MNNDAALLAGTTDPRLASNKRAVLAFLNCAFGNKVEEAAQYLADDARWWVSGPPDRLKVAGDKTRAQIDRLLGSMGKAVPGGMRHQVHALTAEADRVAADVAAEGTWIDGRLYINRYHFLIEFRDGLIVSVREYMDTLRVYDMVNPGA